MKILKGHAFQLAHLPEQPLDDDEEDGEPVYLLRQCRALEAIDLAAAYTNWRRTSDHFDGDQLKPGHAWDYVRWQFYADLCERRLIEVLEAPRVPVLVIDRHRGPYAVELIDL